jgi:asparagine synthase (glutamine-hydrolysing)
MCGFVCYVGQPQDIGSIELLYPFFDRLKRRGPDSTDRLSFPEGLHFTFHRLAIMDPSAAGSQPMRHPDDEDLVLVCNGEIYNHKDLVEQYGFNMASGSDCEVILHMYRRFGIERTLAQLDGVFALALYDRTAGKVIVARDPMGVRPAFVGTTKKGAVVIASEAKAMTDYCDQVRPFPPGKFQTWDVRNRRFCQRQSHYDHSYLPNLVASKGELLESVRDSLTSAVEKRLGSDREIGCLLSGGLDSSLVAALVSRGLGRPVKTFSIGMEGSVDLKYARLVADHIGSDHHEIELNEEDFLKSIPKVVRQIESYDTTTVRASVGNFLVAKYVRENSDCKVIFNGDGSDEVCCGYVYNKNAPSLEALQDESLRLVREIHLFDVLRSDRSISSNGLEPRTPFLDKAFVRTYMSIPAMHKQFGEDRIEKYMLRKAFEGTGLLPPEVLWRRKCAFSDGVSSIRNSWHKLIQSYVDALISDGEYLRARQKIEHCRPQLKESYYYRRLYEGFFNGHVNLIPHFWMPRWTDSVDPSARELAGYRE